MNVSALGSCNCTGPRYTLVYSFPAEPGWPFGRHVQRVVCEHCLPPLDEYGLRRVESFAVRTPRPRRSSVGPNDVRLPGLS